MKLSFIHFHCYVPFETDKNIYTYLYININELFCFQLGAVKNNAAITLMHVFFGTPLHNSLLGIYFRGNCWIKGYVFDQIYRTLSKSFSKVTAQIYILTGNVWELYWVFIWTVVIRHFYGSHTDGGAVVSHFGFKFFTIMFGWFLKYIWPFEK